MVHFGQVSGIRYARAIARQKLLYLRCSEGDIVPENIAKVRVTEAELARDLHDVLAKVQEGVEVIVEQDNRPIAVIRLPHRSGRPISEIVQEAKERNSTVTLDHDFGKDVETIIASHLQSWNPPSWE